MRLRLVKEPFDNPDYIFELKHDGFRALAYIDAGECRLVSRNLKSLRFESLRSALGKLPMLSIGLMPQGISLMCLECNVTWLLSSWRLSSSLLLGLL
jgi:hypothetical protein